MILSLQEAMKYTCLSRFKLLQFMEKGELKYINIGDKGKPLYRFKKESLDEFLNYMEAKSGN